MELCRTVPISFSSTRLYRFIFAEYYQSDFKNMHGPIAGKVLQNEAYNHEELAQMTTPQFEITQNQTLQAKHETAGGTRTGASRIY